MGTQNLKSAGSELSRKITKYDLASLTFSARHVEITDSQIKPDFLLGQSEYQVNTIGLTNTLDFRESPYVNPRGFLLGNTIDVSPGGFGSDIEFIRSTMRVGYYDQVGPKPLTPGVVDDQPISSGFQRWVRHLRSHLVRVPALFIRLRPVVPTKQPKFRSTNVSLTAEPQRFAVSANANSARTIITVTRSAEDFYRIQC